MSTKLSTQANKFVGPPDTRVTKPEPNKFLPPPAPNTMDQALAQPVKQGGGFDLNHALNQMLFTHGGKHIETNTDGTMKSFDNPGGGIDWVRQHTASPEEMQQRQARMQADKQGPAWSPHDNAAEFNKLLNMGKGPQVQTRENAQGGTMRLAMDAHGHPVGSSTSGPGFPHLGNHMPKDGYWSPQGKQETSQAIGQDANIFAKLLPQDTYANAVASMPLPEITPTMKPFTPNGKGRNRAALGLGPTQAEMNIASGMPAGTYDGPTVSTTGGMPGWQGLGSLLGSNSAKTTQPIDPGDAYNKYLQEGQDRTNKNLKSFFSWLIKGVH